ncbi:Protein pih1d3 [Entophlyctis luteolus]|nr:Protein pih1d3 [Entophlyctis luteolus]
MDIPYTDYSSLTALFKSGLETQIQDDGKTPRTTQTAVTPGTIGNITPPSNENTSTTALQKKGSGDTADIWDAEDIDQLDLSDNRPQPEYTVTHRQKVSSEDMYLQMSGKTPGFHDTDELVISVQLPGVLRTQIEIGCADDCTFELRCPQL